MGSRRNREELGDCCGFCLGCGWGRRFMSGVAADIPEACPDCGGTVIAACPACGEPIVSLMGVSCRECGEPLREPVLFGVEIRRKGERIAVAVDAPPCASDNESTAA